MIGTAQRSASLSLAILFLVFTVSAPSMAVTQAVSSTTTNTFVVTGATWGTGSTSLEVGPGSISVPLVVSLQFLGSSQASRIQATLNLPTGVADVYGNAQPAASAVSIASNTAFSLTYSVDISQTFPTGTYSIPMGIKYNYTSASTTTAGYFFESHTVSARILGTVQMSAASSMTSVNAGEVNNVTITLTNRGTGAASQINPTVTSSAGSVLNTLPQITSLAGGASVALPLRVYVPAANAGSAVTLTLATTYTDAYGTSGSSSLPVGFYAVTVPEPVLSFSTAGASLTPGQVNEIAVTLTNTGPGGASAVRTTVSAPTGFSVLNQFPQVSSLQVGQSVNSTLRLFAPTSAAGTAATLTFTVVFTDPYGYAQSITQTLGLYTASSVAISAATSLSVSTSTSAVTAGLESPVAFVVKNTGQQPVFAPSISLVTTSPLVVSVNSTVTLAGVVISPGASITYSAKVITATTATGGSYAGTLTITYNDQFGDSHTQTVPVAFVVTLPISQVSVASIVSQIAVGRTSTVAFMISNAGTASVYSPVFSLTVPSGLSVTANATFTKSGLVINPGQRLKYVANVTDGPKTAEGAYIATLTVSYSDQFGNPHSSTFSVGLVAIGSIQMVVQNQKVTRNGTTFSVGGTLLNEGLANAYYTQVTAVLTSGTSTLATATSYVGEVDSNTPLPLALSLTVPANTLGSANGTGTMTITAAYQNDFGQALQFKTTQRVQLSGGAPTGGSTGPNSNGQASISAQTLELIRYAAIGGILVAALATVVYVRRGRSKRGKANPKSDVY